MKGMKDKKDAEGSEVSVHPTSTAKAMIEKAPGFEIGALISGSRSRFNHLQLQFFLSFVPFMSFLFRLFGKPAVHGVESCSAALSHHSPARASHQPERLPRAAGR